MYRFVQKHGKKLLAVFSAFLMISFAASGMLTPGASGQNPVVGRLDGKEKIRAADVFAARQDWQLLSRIPAGQQGRAMTSLLGPGVEAEITRQPVLFLLLQKEAEKLGVTVSEDNLQTMLANNPNLTTTDADRNDQIRRAIRGLLLVINGAQRAASVIKVTDPMVRHQLAQIQQSITLDMLDFTTAKYLDQAKAQPITAEQLKAHFDKYADTVAGDVSDTNPFGFGYKYPDRVKLQYVAITRADVRKAVEASKKPYDWEVESRKYYRQNQAQFRADATTQPKQAFDLSAPSTQATTKPYEQVAQEVKDRLVNTETDRRMNAIRDRLVSTMASDWVAYRNAVGASANTATQPATAPTTSAAPLPSTVGVPYASFEYLQKLAQQIQQNKDLAVLPTAVSIADRWLTADDLGKLPGIGQAHLNGVPMASYIMSTAAPFVPEAQRKEGGWLRVLEPTRPMEDPNDSIYIVRLIAADPSHRPATIAEVEQQLRNDLLTARAYDLAKADAQQVLAQARELGSLKAAAGDRPIITAGPITNRPGQAIAPLALTGAAADRFTGRAFRLLATTQPTGGGSGGSGQAVVAPSTNRAATTTAPSAVATTQGSGAKPIDLIELPRDGRVLVAQLGDVQAMWTERSYPLEEAQIHMALGRGMMQRFLQSWFNYDAVVNRLNFVPEGDAELLQGGAPPAQPPPPIL